MSGTITLHKTKGVNARLTYCNRCYGESPELILLGSNDNFYQCSDCKQTYIGKPTFFKCKTRNCHGNIKKTRVIEDHEKLPSMDICDACKLELKAHADEVAMGGVYWKCNKCGQSGVVKNTSDFAKQVRDAHKIYAPDPCGVDFTDDADTMCPICSGVITKQ